MECKIGQYQFIVNHYEYRTDGEKYVEMRLAHTPSTRVKASCSPMDEFDVTVGVHLCETRMLEYMAKYIKWYDRAED